MAGDWIKVEKATARKPEVLRIAELLNIHPDHAFGLCVRFWCWCDDHLNNHGISLSLHMVDTIFDRPSFGDALIRVGWLRVRDGSLEVPNAERHLSHTAKARAHATERKRKSRRESVTESCDIRHTRVPISRPLRHEILSRDDHTCRFCGWTRRVEHFGPYVGAELHIDHLLPVSRGGQTVADNLVTSCSVCNKRKGARTPEEAGMSVTPLSQKSVTREEKRREEREYEDNPPYPPAGAGGVTTGVSPPKAAKVRKPPFDATAVAPPGVLDTPAFRAAWVDWVADRKSRGKGLTEKAVALQFEALARVGPDMAAQALRRSIANGWTGVFPEKEAELGSSQQRAGRARTIGIGTGQVTDPLVDPLTGERATSYAAS